MNFYLNLTSMLLISQELHFWSRKCNRYYKTLCTQCWNVTHRHMHAPTAQQQEAIHIAHLLLQVDTYCIASIERYNCKYFSLANEDCDITVCHMNELSSTFHNFQCIILEKHYDHTESHLLNENSIKLEWMNLNVYEKSKHKCVKINLHNIMRIRLNSTLQAGSIRLYTWNTKESVASYLRIEYLILSVYWSINVRWRVTNCVNLRSEAKQVYA